MTIRCPSSALVAPCLLVVAACGGGTTGAIATPSATAATATVAPTPTPDVRAIAAQQYLAAVTAYNLANDAAYAAYKKIPNGAPWSALVPATRTLYTAALAEEQAVFAIHFPPDMATDASAIVSALNSELVRLGDLISNPSLATWNAWDTVAAAWSSASNAVRHDLGLPPVPLATP